MSDSADNFFTQHGGNLSFIARNFPDAPRPFIDLSTGINPYPYQFPTNSHPTGLTHLHSVVVPEVGFSPSPPRGEGTAYRLADVTEMEELRKSAASFYQTEAENINIASGMQPLMFALASLRLQKHGVTKIAILSPTYSEYEKIWNAAGHQVLLVYSLEELTKADVAIICNPNNPDGKIYTSAQIQGLNNDWLIIDESFADLYSSPTTTHYPPSTIRMRSCGKFFGIAGMRISSVIAPKEISRWLRVVVGDWPVTTQACLQLPTMFADTDWIEQSRLCLEQESELWRRVLAKYFTIMGYTSLFTLVETDYSEFWHENLAKKGILVRKFAYNKQWLRFGLPDRKHLERIENALGSA